MKDGKYSRKIICSGNVIEYYDYEIPVSACFEGRGGRLKNGEGESDKKEKNRRETTRKARNKIRRLALANFSSGDKFVTLTYDDKLVLHDIKDIKQCNETFKKFIKRLKYVVGDFKYISVVEFQDTNNRGAVHYHFLSDMKYIPIEKLTEIWGMGFCGINAINHVDNIGAYISAYMTKNTNDERFQGQRSYMYSRNLDKPIEIKEEKHIKEIEKIYNIKEKTAVFANHYESEYNGIVKYREYNLLR